MLSLSKRLTCKCCACCESEDAPGGEDLLYDENGDPLLDENDEPLEDT